MRRQDHGLWSAPLIGEGRIGIDAGVRLALFEPGVELGQAAYARLPGNFRQFARWNTGEPIGGGFDGGEIQIALEYS